MKLLSALILIVATLCIGCGSAHVAPTPAASPLNGGFEESVASDGSIPHWMAQSNPGFSAVLTTVETHSGHQALSVVNSSGVAYVYSDAFAVTPGASGTLQFWTRVQGVGMNGGIVFGDSGGKVVGMELVQVHADAAVDWTLRSVPFTVPAGAKHASITFSGIMYMTTSFQVDDVSYSER